MSTTVTTTQTSQAAIFYAPGNPFGLVALPLRQPRAGEVRVRVSCCTICGSDVHTYRGHRLTPTPTVLGHEILGVIDAIGADQQVLDHEGIALHVGDRITWSIAASCGDCFYCNDALPQKCEHLFKYGHEKVSDDHPLSGGLAQHCLLAPGTAIVRVPDCISDLVACPANCATATVAAALRIARIRAGQTVLIQGMGALGLTACAMAREMGARYVIGCDVVQERLELGRQFGVTHTVRMGDAEGDAQLARLAKELTQGRGIDVAIELSGSRQAMQAAVPLLRIGGRYTLVGAVCPTDNIVINPEMVVRRMLTILGLHNYTPDDLLTAVRFLTQHHQTYPFEQLVQGSWPLNEADAAFTYAIKHHALRVAIRPSPEYS